MQEVALSALAALSLFLAGATVSAELVTPLWTNDQALAAQEAPPRGPRVGAYLEAVLQRTDLVLTNATGDARCAPLRTMKTTYRPVVLVNQTQAGCPATELVSLEFTLESRGAFDVLATDMALCPAHDYTMASARHGDRLSAVGSPRCAPLSHDGLPLTRTDTRRHTVVAVVTADHFAATGLKVACAAALVGLPNGSTAVVQDLTWFEVWAPEDGPPTRPGHLQSSTANTPCAAIGLPFEPGRGGR